MKQTIEWIKSQELPSGGLAAWPGEQAYPEVTGYMIPTLINWGEDALADRLANWLLSIQNSDGSFNGLDGVPRAFDTAAVVEGLRATGNKEAEKKALAWLETQIVGSMLRSHPASTDLPVYNLRALAVMGHEYYDLDGLTEPPARERMHYYLYALEGLFNMGHEAFVSDMLEERVFINKDEGLVPHFIDGLGSDMCATAQAAFLRLRCGLDASDYVEAVRKKLDENGSLPHDNRDPRKVLWPLKYYLDMEHLLKGKRDDTDRT